MDILTAAVVGTTGNACDRSEDHIKTVLTETAWWEWCGLYLSDSGWRLMVGFRGHDDDPSDAIRVETF